MEKGRRSPSGETEDEGWSSPTPEKEQLEQVHLAEITALSMCSYDTLYRTLGSRGEQRVGIVQEKVERRAGCLKIAQLTGQVRLLRCTKCVYYCVSIVGRCRSPGFHGDKDQEAKELYLKGIASERAGESYLAMLYYRQATKLVPEVERLCNFSDVPTIKGTVTLRGVSYCGACPTVGRVLLWGVSYCMRGVSYLNIVYV